MDIQDSQFFSKPRKVILLHQQLKGEYRVSMVFVVSTDAGARGYRVRERERMVGQYVANQQLEATLESCVPQLTGRSFRHCLKFTKMLKPAVLAGQVVYRSIVRPISFMASITMPLPTAIIRMSWATRTKR